MPTEAIRSQTLRVLKDRESAINQSIRRELGEFTVLEVNEALYMQPATLETGHVIIVATMQSFKREDTSGLTAYKENGNLMPHFRGIIITVDKSREGWDCPVAYVLMTFRNSSSATAVEQVVGRVLRMPSVKRKQHETLNRAYAYACSNQFGEIVQNLRDGLVQNGFEKMDAKELIIAPEEDEDDLFSQLQETVLSLPEDDKGVVSPPDLSVFSSADLKKIDLTPEAGRMTVQGNVTPALRKKILSAFKDENHKSAIDQELTLQAEKQTPERPLPASRRGEKFAVPQLLIRQGDFLTVFDETTLIEGDWELASFDPVLNEQEFPTHQEAIQRARFGINKSEKVDVRAYDELEAQLSLLDDEGGWDLLSLSSWLDSNIPFPYSSRDEKVAWIRRVLEELINKRELTIETLAYRKFRLRKAVEEKLKSGLQKVQQAAFKEILEEERNLHDKVAKEIDHDTGIITASEKHNITFREGHYAYDDPYSGYYQFRKHFFGVIGNLKSQGEEFECAMSLDQMPEVEYWVKNVEKKPGSFWLPTSRHRFYPDFVAKLTDGRILVVEYKGSKLSEAASEREKDDIGKLWASRSEN